VRCESDRHGKFFDAITRGYLKSFAASIIFLKIIATEIRLQTGIPQDNRRTGCVPAEATMTVKSILDSKGTDVATIDPSADLASAVKLLAAHRIGALVVVGSDQRIAGIISERDIIRELADRGAAALEQQVGHVMTRKIVTCSRAETISSVMDLMTDGKFRHLPVVEEGRLIGIVSIGDVVKHRVHEIESESATLRDYIRST
jgi:CBS domain-containing protein